MNILFRILTYWNFSLSFFRRKVFIDVKENELVLDIGSGNKPFWRGDVIVDKYIEDDQQRATDPMVYDKRKIFVQADVEKLPFKDKAFDFVFCAHLLEHVKNLDKAIQEIIRVAKRGYIEVPQAIELIKNKKMYKHFQKNGLLWAKSLTWEKSTRQSLALLEQVSRAGS